MRVALWAGVKESWWVGWRVVRKGGMLVELWESQKVELMAGLTDTSRAERLAALKDCP